MGLNHIIESSFTVKLKEIFNTIRKIKHNLTIDVVWHV